MFFLKFLILQFHMTPLYLAVEKQNIEIIKYLLTNDKIDVNILNNGGIKK